MSEDSIQFVCEVCGKAFDPDPDTMRELHWTPDLIGPEEAEKCIEQGIAISIEDFRQLDDEQLQQIGLDRESHQKLLNGEHITAGAICVCKACQDEMIVEKGDEVP